MACFVITSLFSLFTSTVLFIPTALTCVVMHMVFANWRYVFALWTFSSYVAYLHLHIVIIRNTVVYPIFKLNSHITFVFQCLQVRDFTILHWWSLSTTRSCILSDSKQNYLPTMHCVWCDTRRPLCKHHRYPCTEGTSFIWVYQLCCL